MTFIPKVHNVKIVAETPPNGLMGSPEPQNAHFRTLPTNVSFILLLEILGYVLTLTTIHDCAGSLSE